MLKNARSYEEACRTFRWRIPERYNLAFDVCDRQTMAGADGHRTALIVETAEGGVERYTFHVLRLLSNRLANVLSAHGVLPGDRVAVSFGPSVEAAVALLGVLKMGAVAVPVPMGLGSEPLSWRLAATGARAALLDGAVARRLAGEVLPPALELVLAAGEAPQGAREFWAVLEQASDAFAPVVTSADDPALILFPDDACGHPRGVLLAHRAMPGGLPAVELALGFFPQFGDVLWTAADWMTAEGLLWSLLPAWHHGIPVVARGGPLTPDEALALMARHGVRAAFLPPADLARLTEAAARQPRPLPRALASGPDPLPAALHDEVMRVFGTNANEIWGVRETGAVLANAGALMEIRPGSPGRAAPGVTVDAVDEAGRVLRAGERGILAVAPGASCGFLGYWGEDGASARLSNGWLLTGRLGSRDLDGYVWPESLAVEEGVVLVEGRRVRLDEVGAALSAHPAAAAAAVTGHDDPQHGFQLKAHVVAAPGQTADVALARSLQDWVAARRAAHEIPRRVEFVTTLPAVGDDGGQRQEPPVWPIRLDAPSAEDRWTPSRK